MFDVVVFEGPDVLSEFGLVTVFSAAELCGVVSISCVINFLDVAFSLNRSTYQPFTKPNTPLQYIHRERNHPPITIENIPAGINKRLSSSKRCNLCLKEKFLIICRPELSTLNKRNELVSSCLHRNKALLCNN